MAKNLVAGGAKENDKDESGEAIKPEVKTNDASEAGRALGKLGASKGGIARRDKLSPEERSEIARRAVETRWAKTKGESGEDEDGIPRAICGSPDRPLKIGAIELQAYVLADGTRLLSQAEFLEALGRHRKANVRNEGGEERLPAILQGKSINPFIGEELIAKSKPIKFRTPSGSIASGYRAELLPEVCEVYLKAREAGMLNRQLFHVAKQAEILIRGLANVGIIALVDEATGYQFIRPRLALEEILEKFIAKELVAWQKTFPDDFYENIFRLKGWKITPGSTKRPMILAKLTVDLVYRRLAPGVLKELRDKSPKDEKGRRKNKLFQWLTEDVGNPKLKEHFAALRSLWRVSDDFDTFYALTNRALPMFGETMDLPFQIEHDSEKAE